MSGCNPPVNVEGFLVAHGTALILPLAIVEGPIVTLVTGFLSAQKFIAWYWAVAILLCGEVIGDLMYYWIGRTGATPLGFLGRRIGIRPPDAEVQRGLTENATRMLLIGKWTHAVGFVVLVGSGMLRVPLPRFIVVNLLAATPKIALLFGLGYFAGKYYPYITHHAFIAALFLCVVGTGALLYVLWRVVAARVRR
jgi:membrane protein DedA with SNARE-associated domain